MYDQNAWPFTNVCNFLQHEMTSTHNFTIRTDHKLVPLFVAKPRALSRLAESRGRRRLVTMSQIFYQVGPCVTISFSKGSCGVHKSQWEKCRGYFTFQCSGVLHFSDVLTTTMLLQIHNAKDNAATVLEELYKYCHFFILDEEAMQYVLHFENIIFSNL